MLGGGKQPVVLLCMSSSPCHWVYWALEMSRHGGNVVSPFLAHCRFTCSRGAGFQGPYACLCVSVGLDSDCSALFQWGLCFCIPLCAVLSVSPPLRVSGLKNLVLSWVTWLPFFFSLCRVSGLYGFFLHTCVSVFLLCVSWSQALGHDVPIILLVEAFPLSSCYVPAVPTSPSSVAWPWQCPEGLGMVGEELWGEVGPTGLSCPEQVGLLIWLTAALRISCFPWPLPPSHRLAPVSGHVR